MIRKFTIPTTLVLNLAIFGYYLVRAAFDYNTMEAYRQTGLFNDYESLSLLILTMSVVLLSLAGLLKLRWAALGATLIGACLYCFFCYALISWYFDPLEKGRNGDCPE